ncbi:hypothetical protein [Microbacterium invictum]|uniref:Uncharacterized protein n=1 Tax=Microbacterium invictum TaxID=515415 RepID=A0AA40SP51_9MICO|nr:MULTISPECIES: hypothetical protein [Microbacterium]MBB4139793.1 hypothetical protein [Microbacterium invictum]
MNISVRSMLSGLAVAFTAYLAVGGLLWTVSPDYPLIMIATLALFLVTTWLCIFWNVGPRQTEESPAITAELGRRSVLPGWAAVLAVANAAIVPAATWFAAGPDARLEAYATWSLGGISALMTIVMVRRRTWTAWIGATITAVEAVVWIGPRDALALGVVGLVVWVGVAQIISRLVERAARDTADLTELQRAAGEWLASQDGRRSERRTQVQRALAVAGPVLVRTVESDGDLDDDERERARLAEGRLRDDIRGRRLLDDTVSTRLEAARRRGAAVTVLDEGGLEGVDDEGMAAVRAELAEALAEASSERIYVRTSSHPQIAVTVVGRSRPKNDPGADDQVDLWREIRRPDARDDDASES